MVSTRNLKPKFSIGEKVLCYEPDPLKAKVLYNSKVLKILDDKEGKRGLEFLIHFSGWNSTWDRYVTEDFILKDTEENRKLQQELAEKAQLTPGGNLYRREQRRSKKHHHHHHHHYRHRKPSSSMSPNPYTDDNMTYENGEEDSQDDEGRMNETRDNGVGGDETSSTSDRTDTMSSCSDSENINIEFPSTCRSVNPALPLNHFLHNVLVNDHIQVKQNNMVVSLPASPSIVEILDGFYRHYAALEINAFPNRTPSTNENAPPTLKDLMKSLNSLIHIVDGVRIYFDFSVKATLLYNNEHKQFDFYRNNFQRNTPAFRNAMRDDINASIKKEAATSKKESMSLHKEMPSSTYRMHHEPANTYRNEAHKEMPSAGSYKKDSFASMMLRDLPHPSHVKKEVGSTNKEGTNNYRKPDIRSYSPSNRRDHLAEKVLNSNNVLSSLSNSEGNVLSNHNSSESNILSNHSSEGSHQRLDSVSSVDSTMSGRTTSSVSSGGGTAPLYLADWDQTRSSLLDKLAQWVFIPDHVLQASPPMASAIYGAVHLSRLFVKLPGMLSNSVLSDEKIEYILEVVQDLAEYISEHEDWFRPNIYVNNTF
ncbi:hypothetical protein M8J76_011192 [Diaphorina citri]|nr:hypothetical protein M8J76_011192 [Diaphorina citri]